MLKFQFFPRSVQIPFQLQALVDCFQRSHDLFRSDKFYLKSNEVLTVLSQPLKALGYRVEGSKKKDEKIQVPVLFGLNNRIDKSFDADAVSADGKIVLEVEAGRGYANNQFLKDIFQACMMPEVEYLVIAVRNDYKGVDDFGKIYNFIETLYVNGRLVLPLHGVLLIGY
jgi:hypothetical protein